MDPSQTRRVVLLVDLHPLLALEDSAAFTDTVLACARRLLSFPPLASSLFACKPFFSSLSPLLSTSAVHRLLGKPAAFLSFDRPSQALDLLSHTLLALSTTSAAEGGNFLQHLGPSRASLVAESLFQLAYDCIWEAHAETSAGKDDISSVRPNLVAVLSPLPHSTRCLSQFLDLEAEDEILLSAQRFRAKFISIFNSVKDLFVAKDVHCAWLDVGDDSYLRGDILFKGMVEKGIEDLGWGLCSADAIILGSILVPFGLIYPYIGCRLDADNVHRLGRGRAEVSLAISDVSGMPLECKCCNLEVLALSIKRESTDIWEIFSRDVAKVLVKKVWRISGQAGFESNTDASFILRVFSSELRQVQDHGDFKGSQHGKTEGLFADRVLELFRDNVAVAAGKPVWQLILAFLVRRSSIALVSVPLESGNSLLGVLRPFTVHSAILYIVGDSRSRSLIPELDAGLNLTDMPFLSESAVSGDIIHGRKKNKKHLSMIQNLAFDSFRKYAFSQTENANSEVDLEDLYFANRCHISKKLRFLQCWIRQTKKSKSCTRVDDLGRQLGTKEDTEEKSTSSQQESFPAEVAQLSGIVVVETPPITFLEDSTTFAESVSQKISHVVSSEEVDLGFSAERLVNSTIKFFSAKFGMNKEEEDLLSEEGSKCHALLAAEVTTLLLQKPKDLLAKYKSYNASSLATNPVAHCEVNKVREHELQILFRMEILQSEISSSIEENLRSKMVKDICLLLGNIEFNLQGEMFAGESLIDFTGRIIKTRYAHSLEDVVHRIYYEMEFFSFDEVDEDSASLPNSNGDPCRDEAAAPKDTAEAAVNPSLRDTHTVGDPSRSCDVYSHSAHRGTGSADHNVLIKAQERRERARRFSHFTSWRRNLQRVWAPKHGKVGKPTHESFHRSSRKRRRRSSLKDTVCETPMVHLQNPAAQHDDRGEAATQARLGTSLLSKALFQE